MKVLWISNILLPEFCGEFNINTKPKTEGWMSGMLHGLERFKDLTVGLCFPIIDENRMKDGELNDHPFFSYHYDLGMDGCTEEMVDEFEIIVKKYQPDVIHIWGTEYAHSAAVVKACERIGCVDRIVTHIQGLVSFYADHFALGIPDELREKKREGFGKIQDEIDSFRRRGKLEHYVMQHTEHIMGRTEWDKICALTVNPDINYWRCEELLRNVFYNEIGTWDVKKCRRHRIFVSQALYPVKGFHFMIPALSILKKKYPDLEVHVAGHNIMNPNGEGMISPYAEYLSDLIEQYDVKENVHFVGLLDAEQILVEYQEANVSVCPSVIENSANSICEAMLVGTPIVASYVGGTPDMIEHGKSGFLYQCDASYMMAYYIGCLFDDDKLAERVSKAAVEMGSRRQDRRAAGEQLVNIYKSIMESSR